MDFHFIEAPAVYTSYYEISFTGPHSDQYRCFYFTTKEAAYEMRTALNKIKSLLPDFVEYGGSACTFEEYQELNSQDNAKAKEIIENFPRPIWITLKDFKTIVDALEYQTDLKNEVNFKVGRLMIPLLGKPQN
jgi:hypothetical protein